MLNIFRRHVAACPNHGKRTGQKCPRKPTCPIHIEGIDGQGRKVSPKALIDPRNGHGIRDWARAMEILRDLESPSPVILPDTRVSIPAAVDHFQKSKSKVGVDRQRKVKNLLTRFTEFMSSPPRNHRFISDVRYHDLTDWMSTWTHANSTQRADRELLKEFTTFCSRAEFTVKNIGDGLPSIPDTSEAAEPFLSRSINPTISPDEDELEKLWRVLPDFPDEYGRKGTPIARQTEAFVYIMRYTGMDVSTTLTLKKTSVRGNNVRTARKKTGEEVWTVLPGWVVEKLWAAPHDAEDYFFWSGKGKPHTRASKWFNRLRKLLDLAGLQHRTPHNFRHHFAIEMLTNGVPIDHVARLLGHGSVKTTEKSYGKWVKGRQDALEAHLFRIHGQDPLSKRMDGIAK